MYYSELISWGPLFSFLSPSLPSHLLTLLLSLSHLLTLLPLSHSSFNYHLLTLSPPTFSHSSSLPPPPHSLSFPPPSSLSFPLSLFPPPPGVRTIKDSSCTSHQSSARPEGPFPCAEHPEGEHATTPHHKLRGWTATKGLRSCRTRLWFFKNQRTDFLRRQRNL